jgi:hypothetical protein
LCQKHFGTKDRAWFRLKPERIGTIFIVPVGAHCAGPTALGVLENGHLE